MSARRLTIMVIVAAVIGLVLGRVLQEPHGAAVESGVAAPLPISGTDSSVGGVVRSVHGYLYWPAAGPDIYPETARQIDCLITRNVVAARMVVSLERPDPVTIRFGYRPAHGPVLSAVVTAPTRRVHGMREYVAIFVEAPAGDASALYPRGPRERCWALIRHEDPVALPGRPSS